ncbi:hypothetical protein C8Q77DRAFT_1074835 [Trametes polyzona]|nr:hypothetical protein C8Q77DRAFT_1074835 [Trametes polyzona]
MAFPPSELLEAYCPPSDLPVSELLEWSHSPKRPGSRKLSLPPAQWLSKESPSVTEVPVEGLLLPSSRICQALEPLLRTVEDKGVCSVQHPTEENSYLPLWIIPIWKGADEVLRMQQQWRVRLVWIERTAKAEKWSDHLLESLKASMHHAPSMAGLEALQRGTVSVAHLARVLLSDEWLDDEVLDCLGDVFRIEAAVKSVSEAGDSESGTVVQVASAHLRTCLLNVHSGIARFYETQLVSGTVVRLFLPCNINNLHWIPVEIDFNMTALETGLQQDTWSCGIATANTIERRMNPSTAKWSPEAPGKARARYFIRIIEAAHTAISNEATRTMYAPALLGSMEGDTAMAELEVEDGHQCNDPSLAHLSDNGEQPIRLEKSRF